MILPSILFFCIITALAPLLGRYISWVFRYSFTEHEILKNDHHHWQGQTWLEYFSSLICFNLISIIFTFAIIYYQAYLPTYQQPNNLNFAASLNAAISFTTGTFWQSHNPETDLSLFAHIFAITVQNFLSGATSIAVFIAFVRGIINSNNPYIGNFYDDFLRAIIFILLPFTLFIALLLVNYGTPYEFGKQITFYDLEGKLQNFSIAPIAGQVAIKNFIANGGSLLDAASAHPFESPSREAVMINLILVFLMPIAMIFAYGYLVNAKSLSWSLYLVVIIIVLISLIIMNIGETKFGLPLILGENQLNDNFNYIGKELIYDKFPSLMWILSITLSSDGSVNSCLENYSPLSTLVLFFNLIMSKFVIEGVGSGFFSMLSYLIVAVFLRGLITGETANFFGKKITINEINYVIIVFLLMPVGVLLFTSITLLLPYSQELIIHHGSQAITDITYNFASTFANNGSDFSGMNIQTNYFNYMTALAMFLGRYIIIYLSLAISGSFAVKQRIKQNIRHTQSNIELSIFLLITVLLVGAIIFVPLMILGPLLEFINM